MAVKAPSAEQHSHDLSSLELGLLNQAIMARYGYDFSGYAQASFKRRVINYLSRQGLQHVSQLIPRLLHNRHRFEDFLQSITVTVSEIFRDPQVYLALRQQVLPKLASLEQINIWHAGCATGEEAFSMAILLRELKLEGKSQIYATDINKQALEQAQQGCFAIKSIRQATRNYQLAGGQAPFTDYYQVQEGGRVRLEPSLTDTITLARHNLVQDESFNSMALIVCRNVLIYFTTNRVRFPNY